MSEIFISYSSKDRKTARSVVKVLEQSGWHVWWDKNIPPGKPFDRAISQALDAAKMHRRALVEEFGAAPLGEGRGA
jgi:sulfatase modifying factor 1